MSAPVRGRSRPRRARAGRRSRRWTRSLPWWWRRAGPPPPPRCGSPYCPNSPSPTTSSTLSWATSCSTTWPLAAALAELRRVTRPGGRIALTVWASPPASGQALLGRAVQAAGVTRPADAPRLAAQDDFPRTETGFAALLVDAGLAAPACETLAWTHHVDAEAWWSGPAAGIATIGQIVTAQPPAVIASIRAHYDALCAPFRTPAGPLALPHTALLAHATA